MKNYIKKALLALMVGIGMMGAVGMAGAQTNTSFNYYKVDGGWNDNLQRYGLFEGSPDQICSEAAIVYNNRVDHFPEVGLTTRIIEGVYLGQYDLNHPSYIGWARKVLFCYIDLKMTAFYSYTPEVQVVQYSSDTAFEIIEEKEFATNPCEGDNPPEWCEKQCPGDLVKDNNGNCVCPEGTEPAPASQQGVKTFAATGEPPQQCVPTCDKEKGEVWDSQENKCLDPCEGKGVRYYSDGSSKKDYAGMVCDKDGNVDRICVWTDHISNKYPDAVDVLKDCMQQHEEEHMTAKDELLCGKSGRADWIGGGWGAIANSALRECDGYIVELVCIDGKIKNSACDSNQKCTNQLRARRATIINDVLDNVVGGTSIPNCNKSPDGIFSGIQQSYKPKSE